MDRQMMGRLRARAAEERAAANHTCDAQAAARHRELAGRYDDVVEAYSKLGLN